MLPTPIDLERRVGHVHARVEKFAAKEIGVVMSPDGHRWPLYLGTP